MAKEGEEHITVSIPQEYDADIIVVDPRWTAASIETALHNGKLQLKRSDSDQRYYRICSLSGQVVARITRLS